MIGNRRSSSTSPLPRNSLRASTYAAGTPIHELANELTRTEKKIPPISVAKNRMKAYINQPDGLNHRLSDVPDCRSFMPLSLVLMACVPYPFPADAGPW